MPLKTAPKKFWNNPNNGKSSGKPLDPSIWQSEAEKSIEKPAIDPSELGLEDPNTNNGKG